MAEKFFVYIDDTGSPGQEPPHKLMFSNTKVWSAVILSFDQKKYVESMIGAFKNAFQKEVLFSEFHFSDIYSGRNDFENIDSEIRLDIFKKFVELYNTICPYVVIAGIGDGTLKNSGFSEGYIHRKESGLKFSKPDDYALYMLILSLQEYFLERYENGEIDAEIIIDEGQQKANTVQKLSDIAVLFDEMSYKASVDTYGLQFADFIAFSVNRIQNNFSKERTYFDNGFMQIIGKMKLNSNCPTISVKPSNIENINKDYNEAFLDIKRKTTEQFSQEAIQYIELMMDCVSNLENFVSQKSSKVDKDTILQDIKKIKELNYSDSSEEFKDLLDIFEKVLQKL